MNKTFRLVTTILLILLLAVIIFLPKIKPLFGSKSEGAPVRGGGGMMGGQGRQLLNVSGFIINPIQMNEYVNTTGTLLPDEEVELSFETSGKIVAINFTEGTRVKKGDLLAKINDRPLQAQLQKLEAQYKLAEEKEFRQRSLLDRDAISQESYDQIVTELQTIQADINLIKARISETELRAPFDGIIGLRYLSEGSRPSANPNTGAVLSVNPCRWLRNSIWAAMAVLYWKPSMSAVTFLTHWLSRMNSSRSPSVSFDVSGGSNATFAPCSS